MAGKAALMSYDANGFRAVARDQNQWLVDPEAGAVLAPPLGSGQWGQRLSGVSEEMELVCFQLPSHLAKFVGHTVQYAVFGIKPTKAYNQ